MKKDMKEDSDTTLTGLATKSNLTVHWNDIPSWMQDNHYIHSGYRPPSNSYHGSLVSIFTAHNETVNVWTHLLGAVVAAFTSVVLHTTIRPRFQLATPEDVLVFSCFFLGATACLGMSATFHTISNHSHAVAKFGNRLDYMGIVFLIWGSFVPSIYYGFYAEPALIRLYWSMVGGFPVASSDASSRLTRCWKIRSLPSAQVLCSWSSIPSSAPPSGDPCERSCSWPWG